MAELPAGTVTFLFTDVAGSTRLWERHPQLAVAAMARHDALIEEAVARHGGVVVRPRGEGDGRFAVFPRASDAVAAAATLQVALQAEPWPTPEPLRVRLALHAGEADLRAGDYYGSDVNRCARLRALAHPGQALVSGAAAALARGALPAGVALRDLGEHRLKDLTRPEHVYQLDAPGLPAAFPPLASLGARPTNLPVQPTPLIGRECELAAVAATLRDPAARLVTLTGPGGTGKTRLALQVAAELLDEYPDGVWFVDLAPLADPDLVLPAVAGVLGVREAGGQPLAEMLAAYLREKRLLLVLDNCEQVVNAAPHAARLLAAAPGLRALATSRIPLRLSGEREYPVPPLALPDPHRLPPVEQLSQYEAVRLFIERATAVRPDFVVTNANAPAVAAICHRLDGLPLAIELAAARVRLLAPEALLARLEQRLKLLTGGTRDRPDRQRTLRAAIDWSHDLLAPAEQALFARLAVFAGGATLEAVAAVCDPRGDLGVDVLDGVESLAAQSLLQLAEGAGGEPRVAMLETIREYAAERLEASGEAVAIRHAHADYYRALGRAAAVEARGPAPARGLARLDAEHANLRAALRWLLDSREVEPTLHLAGSLWRFWALRGYLAEGRHWLEEALAIGQVAPGPDRTEAILGLSELVRHQGDYPQARVLKEQILAEFRAADKRMGVAAVLHDLALLATFEGDLARGRAQAEEGLALRRELDNARDVAHALDAVGEVALAAGDYRGALAAFAEALDLCRRAGDEEGVAYSLECLGRASWSGGDFERADAYFRACLALEWTRGDRMLLPPCLEGIGSVAEARHQAARAARLWGAAEVLREAVGAPMIACDRPRYEQALAAARAQLDETIWAAAWAEGRAMSAEEAITYALAVKAK